MYEALNKHKKAERLKYTPLPKTEPESKPWWAQLLVNLGFGILSSVFEIMASAVLGPVGGMIVGIVSDIGFSMVADIVTGNDPFAPENIIFNIVMPLASIPGKVKGIKRLKTNKVNVIGAIDGDDNLQKIAKELGEIDLSDMKAGKRAYEDILSRYSKIDKNLEIDLLQSNKYEYQNYKLKKSLENANKRIRYVNKALNMLDPVYAVQEFFSFVTKPAKKLFNKGVSKYFKKIESKIFKKVFKKQNLSKTLIPLNHTVAPWIRGIKLIPSNRIAINHYHVIIFFNKMLTNGKKTVYLYNKPWKNIKQFIESPSAGKYYINNISWGWSIGKMIRSNASEIAGVKVFMSFAYGRQIFYNTFKLAQTIGKTIDRLTHLEEYYDEQLAQNVVVGMGEGIFGGIKGLGLVKPAIRTIQEKNSRYLIKYGAQKVKNTFKKVQKHNSVITNYRLAPYIKKGK